MSHRFRVVLRTLSFSIFLLAPHLKVCAGDDMTDKQVAFKTVEQYVKSNTPYNMVLAPEGAYIAVFNKQVETWIRAPMDRPLVESISNTLEAPLHIALNAKGYAPAATRAEDGEKDETNYDAIWVRDNVWVYYALNSNPQRKEDAKRLLLALWDYYATNAQIARFESIIAKPTLSLDPMSMPHIRFDGNSADLTDVIENGKPQIWNHSQIDAHGLFFTALAEAMLNGNIAKNELTSGRVRVLLLYPVFLSSINFTEFEDAGAWEEITRKNTSSIGLATRSLQVLNQLIYGTSHDLRAPLRSAIKASSGEIKHTWTEKNLNRLAEQGLSTVKEQLAAGGESPGYPPTDVHFRRADAALLHLITPSPLAGLSQQERRQIMLYVEALKRPFGVLRYVNDSYQSGNYWIRDLPKGRPDPTGDTSSQEAFVWRMSQLEPHSEAQWFFDSLIALAWIDIAKTSQRPEQTKKDLNMAKIHVKRALGQLTGEGQIAADGVPVKVWMAPESINTVIIDGQRYYLASPITPLNWAKAGLYMSLQGLIEHL